MCCSQIEEPQYNTYFLLLLFSLLVLCRLADQLAELEGTIKKSQKENGKLEEQLGSLRPTLEKLKQATQPVQEFFSMPLDWEKEQHSLALLLPPLVDE